MIRRPPSATRTDTRLPDTTLFRSPSCCRRRTRPAASPASPACRAPRPSPARDKLVMRSEEHTSDLQSLMRLSYAVFCLNTNKTLTSRQPRHILMPSEPHKLNSQNSTDAPIQPTTHYQLHLKP